MGSTFELTVHRATAAGVWPMVAKHHCPGQLLPVRSEGELRLEAEPASAKPRTYGEALGRALFTGPIRDAYVAARADAPVRVWLCVEDPALRTWRWEWLCGPLDSTGWDFLTLDQRALYSLYLPSLTDRPFPAIGRRDLRALLLVADPADPTGRYGLTTFDASAVVARLRAVFNGRISHDVLARVPEAIGPPTLDGLMTQLTAGAEEGPYSILHLVCHGRFDRDSDETWVYLEQPVVDATGAVLAQGVAATILIERLRRVRQLPHFVFMSVCDSGAPEAEQRLGGLAQRLVRELGIPAVIGMTEPVTVATAHALSEAFYARLLQPSADDIGAVDRALVDAYAGLASRLDVHVPALYSRLGDQPLFSPAVDRELTDGEIRAGLAQLDTLLSKRAPVLQPSVAKHRQALELWLARGPSALSADARQVREASLQAITEICQEALDISFHALAQGTPVPAYDARQPFRGLSPFQADDAKFFFGRDALIEVLRRKLEEDPFLPVLGPSGSGKSSAVLAGLVPRLRHQQPNLQVAYLTPGSTPLEQLYAVQATMGDGPVLYVVDQFEEVFTACRDEATRRAFIDAVLSLTADHPVVLTMRADFWGECAPYAALRARMQARQELIAPMTTSELRSAMEQQAAEVGLRYEADLTHTMLDEVAGEPGAMPLLQHALLELWKRRHGRWLRAAEYRAVGGVKQAIAQTADRLYAELPVAEQDRMRDLFLRLTQLDEHTPTGEERRDTRRRVPFSELVPAGDEPEATKRLVKQLADAVLVTEGRNVASGQNEVEVAHEALIRHWQQLGEWLVAQKEQLRLRDSIARAARDWENGQRESGLLVHRGLRLESALNLLDARAISLNSAELSYLRACSSAESAERDRQRSGRRRAFVALAAGLAAVTVLAIALWRQWDRAVTQARQAEARTRTAVSRQLAADALEQDRADRTRAAMVLATAAIRTDDTTEARRSLVTLLSRQTRLAGLLESPGGRLERLTFNRTASLLAATFSATDIAVWDLAKKRLLEKIHIPTDYNRPIDRIDLAESQDVIFVTLSQRDDNGVLTYRALARSVGAQAALKPLGRSQQLLGTFSSGRDVVVLVEPSGEIGLWDVTRGASVGSLPMPSFFVPAGGKFSQDGLRLAIWSRTSRNSIAVCSIASPSPSCKPLQVNAGSAYAADVAVGDDGSLVVGLSDGRIGFLEAHADSAQLRLLGGPKDSALDCVSALGDGTFVSVEASGSVLLWNPRADALPVELDTVIRQARDGNQCPGPGLIHAPEIREAGRPPRSMLWRVNIDRSGLEAVTGVRTSLIEISRDGRWVLQSGPRGSTGGAVSLLLTELFGSMREEPVRASRSAFSYDSKWLAVGKEISEVALLSLGDEPTLGVAFPDCITSVRGLESSNATMSLDGSTVACTTKGNYITAFDAETGRRRWSVRPPDGAGVPFLVFDRDGKRLAAVGSTFALLNVESGDRVTADGAGTERPARATFSVDGRFLVLRNYVRSMNGDTDANAMLIDFGSSPPLVKKEPTELMARSEMHMVEVEVRRLPEVLLHTAFTPEFPWVPLGLSTFDPAAAELTAATSSAAIHPREPLLAAGMLSGEVEFKSLVRGASAPSPIRAPIAESTKVSSVAFNGDGSALAAAYSIYQTRRAFAAVWDVSRREQILPLVELGGAENPRVEISLDGRMLLTTAGTVRTWQVVPEMWITTACNLIGLTDDISDEGRRLQRAQVADPCVSSGTGRDLLP